MVEWVNKSTMVALSPCTENVMYKLIYPQQVIHHEFYDGIIFLQLVVVNMALNQTWIAMLIFILCTTPNYAFRLSPIISSIAGFTSGFFIPLNDIGWWCVGLTVIQTEYTLLCLTTNWSSCSIIIMHKTHYVTSIEVLVSVLASFDKQEHWLSS